MFAQLITLLLATAQTQTLHPFLTWSDNSTNETNFYIERKSGSGPYKRIATIPANQNFYEDTIEGDPGNTLYTYRVCAFNDSETSSFSNERSFVSPVITTPDVTPPDLTPSDITQSDMTPTDTTPPNSVLISARLSGKSLTLSASATDQESGIARIDFYVDGAKKASDSTQPYTATLDTRTMVKGKHLVIARAFDNAGNFADSNTITVVTN